MRFPAESVDHMRRIDAAPAGRLGAVEDIAAIFEHQSVHRDGAIDGGIDGKREDQVNMVT